MSGGDSNITDEKRSDVENSSGGGESSDESNSEEETKIELMVNARARRSNAGSKMSALIQSTNQEDDFYKSAYGGFNEDDADDLFESPAHSDVDEVDSDFDKPEEEDEPISDEETEVKRGHRNVKGYKEPPRGSRSELLAKNKTWDMARMAGKTVAANSVDAKTQAARLKEAEHTEKVNVESLRKVTKVFGGVDCVPVWTFQAVLEEG